LPCWGNLFLRAACGRVVRRNRDRSFSRKGALVVKSCALGGCEEAVDIAFERWEDLAMEKEGVAVCEEDRKWVLVV
jgi:hypothetical protein